MRKAIWPFFVLALLATATVPSRGATYQFIEGYSALDLQNFPTIDPAYLGGTSGLERDIALDPVRNIIYIARGLANVNLTPTDQDGRTNAIPSPAAIVLTPYNGSNYKDTGLLTAQANVTPISFHQSMAYDLYGDRIYVFGGTNASEGVVTVTPTVYSAAGGSLGGGPNGGTPSAQNAIFRADFKIPNDLGRGGSQRGLAVRSVPNNVLGPLTTVYVGMGSHVQAWRNDSSDPLSPTFPWRRIWATMAPPRQDLASERHDGNGSPIDALAVDDEGNVYFNVRSTNPARIWCIPANVTDLTTSTNSLDFDDRVFGGFSSGGAAVILPVVPRFATPAVIKDGTSYFQRPSGLTAFRQNDRKGLFVSLTPGNYRGVARLMMDPATTTANGGKYVPALIADAFGEGAPLAYQDSVLKTMRLKGANGATMPSGTSKNLMYTEVTSFTNPTHVYFNAFVTDPSKGQTIPTATIGKASIPPLPPAATLTSVTPAQSFTSGNAEITVIGSNFNESTSVRFGDDEAAGVVVDSPTQMRVLTPPHASGMVSVSVQNPGSDPATLTNVFFFKDPPAPFPVTISYLESGTVVLYWPSNPGDRYRVQYRSSFNDEDAWISAPTVTATGTALTFEDQPTSPRFYRVEHLP